MPCVRYLILQTKLHVICEILLSTNQSPYHVWDVLFHKPVTLPCVRYFLLYIFEIMEICISLCPIIYKIVEGAYLFTIPNLKVITICQWNNPQLCEVGIREKCISMQTVNMPKNLFFSLLFFVFFLFFVPLPPLRGQPAVAMPTLQAPQ